MPVNRELLELAWLPTAVVAAQWIIQMINYYLPSDPQRQLLALTFTLVMAILIGLGVTIIAFNTVYELNEYEEPIDFALEHADASQMNIMDMQRRYRQVLRARMGGSYSCKCRRRPQKATRNQQPSTATRHEYSKLRQSSKP